MKSGRATTVRPRRRPVSPGVSSRGRRPRSPSLRVAVGDGLKGFPVVNGEGTAVTCDDAFRLPLSQMKIHLLPAGADQLAQVALGRIALDAQVAACRLRCLLR